MVSFSMKDSLCCVDMTNISLKTAPSCSPSSPSWIESKCIPQLTWLLYDVSYSSTVPHGQQCSLVAERITLTHFLSSQIRDETESGFWRRGLWALWALICGISNMSATHIEVSIGLVPSNKIEVEQMVIAPDWPCFGGHVMRSVLVLHCPQWSYDVTQGCLIYSQSRRASHSSSRDIRQSVKSRQALQMRS